MKKIIIACKTLEDELNEALKSTGCDYPVRWLDSGLHNVPKHLNEALQSELDQVPADTTHVLLAFGSCGNSVVGLTTGDYETILPRVDDCISMLMGSVETRKNYPDSMKTYFLSRGWMNGERNIWVEYNYAIERYGEKTGKAIYEMMFGHYKNLGILDTGCYPIEEILEEAERIAAFLKLTPQTIPASNQYLLDLLTGPWEEERFLIFPPHTTITSDML